MSLCPVAAPKNDNPMCFLPLSTAQTYTYPPSTVKVMAKSECFLLLSGATESKAFICQEDKVSVTFSQEGQKPVIRVFALGCRKPAV